MATVPYSSLADLISLPQLPAALSLAQQWTTATLEKIYYRNFATTSRAVPGSFSATIELVSYQGIAFDLGSTGFRLVLNPDGQAASGYSVVPLAFSYSLGIARLLPHFDSQSVLTSAADFFQLALDALAPTGPQLLVQALMAFEVSAATTDFQQALASFRTKALAKYGSRNSLQLPATPDPDVTTALGQVVDAFAATTGAASITLAAAIWELYVLDADAAQTLTNLTRLLRSTLGDDPLAVLKRLLIPQVSAQARVSLGLEVPRSILLPMELDASTGKYKLVAGTTAKATIQFVEGILIFTTEGGFGHQVEVAASLARAQLGDTGLQISFQKAKLDLSEDRNIPEADADGRPGNFRGFYAKEVDIYLPDGWTPEPGSVQLAASDLLVGTGGVSGRFGVKAGAAPGTNLPANVIVQARLFGDVLVKFTAFDLTLSQSQVTRSGVAGTFSLPNFKDDRNQVVEFPFDLAFSAQGYELALKAPRDNKGKVLPVVVKLAGLVELHFTRLAFGKDADGVYLDLVADVVVTRTIPIVGKALPRKIAISKLRADVPHGLTVQAKPVWADGTTTSSVLERGKSLLQTLDLTIAKVLRVHHVRLSLLEDPLDADKLTALATFDAALGLTDDSTADEADPDGTPPPGFRASVSNAGFTATLRRVPKDRETGATSPGGAGNGNLSLLDVDLGVKLPDAASVSVNAGGLVGSGRLGIFDNGTRYEGGLALAFRDKLHLSAFALLNENLPDGSRGPSLLALITAQFEPVQLGLGFTLKGVGGLLGLHRTADTDYLRGLVRAGQTDKLLFPADVMKNLPAVLATLNGAFPAAKGRYVIGLLAQVGWGTPELISLDVALIVELPAPVRLLVLGVLQALLPTRQNDLLSLRADFLGVIDFAAKKIAFDATLTDSHLWKFGLAGDLAFRLYQGDNPVFVITAGGFHPHFQPPAGAGLTGLRRITLSLPKSDRLRLTLESYFALTSNTVQFGAHLAAYLELCRGLRAEGHFGFDALFQLNPFRVEVDVEASVAIKYGDTDLASVHLTLHLTGPGPWHVWGEASLRILFVKISVDVDATIGERAPTEDTPQPPDVYTPLRAALRDKTNWLVEAPAKTLPGGVVLRPVSAAPGQVFLDPHGTVSLRQRVAPLGVRLDRFGSNPLVPVGGRRFTVPGFAVGDRTYSQATTPDNVVETKDLFAPSQYYALSDGEKLSRPSFEPLTNGLRISSLATLVGAPTGTRRVVEYEQVLVAPAPAGTDAAGSSVAGGAGTARLTADAFGRLAKGGTLGQAVDAARPSARAPDPVGWAADTYEVVRAATLARYDPAATGHAGHEKFGSHFEADQYCRDLVTADARLAGEVLVVPTYQLELA